MNKNNKLMVLYLLIGLIMLFGALADQSIREDANARTAGRVGDEGGGSNYVICQGINHTGTLTGVKYHIFDILSTATFNVNLTVVGDNAGQPDWTNLLYSEEGFTPCGSNGCFGTFNYSGAGYVSVDNSPYHICISPQSWGSVPVGDQYRFYDSGGTDYPTYQEYMSDNQGATWTGFAGDISLLAYFTYPTPDTLNYSNQIPADDWQFNTNLVNHSIIINSSTNFNCSFYINSTLNQTQNNTAGGLDKYISFNVTYPSPASPISYNYSVSCVNSLDSINTPENSYYLDLVNPSTVTSLINDSVYYIGQNFTATFNYSDDFRVFSYNVTLDGVPIAGAFNINSPTAQVNISYDISNLSVGNHTLTSRMADGHTATALKEDYDVGNGLFNNKLIFGLPKGEEVEITPYGGSIFDRFETERLTDRYTFKYNPSDTKKSTYQFEVTTNSPIHIIETDSKYKNYLIFGDHWLDFVLPNQPQTTVNIIKTDYNRVLVTVAGVTDPNELTFSSVGDLNVVSIDYNIIVTNATLIYSPQIYEEATQSIILEINKTEGLAVSNVNLIYNNTNLSVVETIFSNFLRYTSTFQTPSVNPSLSLENKTLIWNFSLNSASGNQTNYSITNNQTIYGLALDDCTSGTYNIINFSVYDETTRTTTGLVNVSIETDFNLTTSDFSWNYNASRNGTGLVTLPICVNFDLFNSSNFYLNSITRYSANLHSVEFHYFNNYSITNTNTQLINLYTLNTDTAKDEYSTSFLVNYQDLNFLNVAGAVIDLLRYYVGQAEYVSVEHALTDDNGNTRLHFVTEDVKYRVVVRKNNQVLYQSSPLLAICQDTPCQINLQEQDEFQDIWDYDTTGNFNWDLDVNTTLRTVTLSFSTVDGTTTIANLNVKRWDGYLNHSVCNKNLTSSAGTIICTIATSELNSSYIAEFGTYNSPKTFRDYVTFYLYPPIPESFTYSGIILTMLLTLTMVMMAVPSGIIATVFFAVVGLIMAGLLLIFQGGSIFAIGSALIWLIVSGGIIIWKASK